MTSRTHKCVDFQAIVDWYAKNSIDQPVGEVKRLPGAKEMDYIPEHWHESEYWDRST
jgi:hypothetical protein